MTRSLMTIVLCTFVSVPVVSVTVVSGPALKREESDILTALDQVGSDVASASVLEKTLLAEVPGMLDEFSGVVPDSQVLKLLQALELPNENHADNFHAVKALDTSTGEGKANLAVEAYNYDQDIDLLLTSAEAGDLELMTVLLNQVSTYEKHFHAVGLRDMSTLTGDSIVHKIREAMKTALAETTKAGGDDEVAETRCRLGCRIRRAIAAAAAAAARAVAKLVKKAKCSACRFVVKAFLKTGIAGGVCSVVCWAAATAAVSYGVIPAGGTLPFCPGICGVCVSFVAATASSGRSTDWLNQKAKIACSAPRTNFCEYGASEEKAELEAFKALLLE